MIELLQLVGWAADIGHAVSDLRKQRKEERAEAESKAEGAEQKRKGR
jgi:hypothetical protein